MTQPKKSEPQQIVLNDLHSFAEPEDVSMIEKHFKDKGQHIPEALVEPLKDLKDRLKKKTETK